MSRSNSLTVALAKNGSRKTVAELEEAALSISKRIQERHLPHGTILGAIFSAPNSDEIATYTRAGDSAIWTGHYLAAESFRYAVTRSAKALENVKRALAGVRSLVDITGTNLLARALVPVDSPLADAITKEEAGHGVFTGTLDDRKYHWIGNASRDQNSGVFFGLAIAHEMVDDQEVRSGAQDLVTRLLEFLLQNHWVVIMPDGAVSTVFLHRPDQRLSFLQVGRQVNPIHFTSIYKRERGKHAAFVILPIALEVLDDHNSYFKFNLDTINLFNLIRLEESSLFRRKYQRKYMKAYNVLRRTTDDHGNTHFNMIDRALKGPNSKRDSETHTLLETWLKRPPRDEFVDLRGEFASCGQPDRACQVIPVERRVPTDFLWQRSPFLLFGGGGGTIEEPGIDFILPFWMARFYQVL